MRTATCITIPRRFDLNRFRLIMHKSLSLSLVAFIAVQAAPAALSLSL